MYRLVAGTKNNPEKRWALPERVFFACGACHILAFAFLERYPLSGFQALWLKPAHGFTGNHIVVMRDDLAFDYHDYSRWSRLLDHFQRKAERWWPGWHAEQIQLPTEVLVSAEKAKAFDGLGLREPGQFLHDALPRARRFLGRFPVPGA